MDLVARLKPIPGKNVVADSLLTSSPRGELLIKGQTERQPLIVRSAAPQHRHQMTLNVGRGALTGIADQGVPEHLIRLEFNREGALFASLIVNTLQRSLVSINGQYWMGRPDNRRKLSPGDHLSLHGEHGREYKYMVTIDSQSPVGKLAPASSSTSAVELLSDTSGSTPLSILSSQSSSSDDLVENDGDLKPAAQPDATHSSSVADSGGVVLSKTCKDRIAEELSCPVCLDIQVCAHTLVPCGHSFCSPCLEGLEQCPQCRADITQFVPARQLDSLITHLTAVGGLLCDDDIQHYQKRKRDAPTTVTFKAGVKRARSEQNRNPYSSASSASVSRAGMPSGSSSSLGLMGFLQGHPAFGGDSATNNEQFGYLHMLQATQQRRLQSIINNRTSSNASTTTTTIHNNRSRQGASETQARRRRAHHSGLARARQMQSQAVGSFDPPRTVSQSSGAAPPDPPAAAGSQAGATVEDAICID